MSGMTVIDEYSMRNLLSSVAILTDRTIIELLHSFVYQFPSIHSLTKTSIYFVAAVQQITLNMRSAQFLSPSITAWQKINDKQLRKSGEN